jgi:hypothetical protein
VTLPVNVSSVVHVPKGATANLTVRVDNRNVVGTEEGGYVRIPVGSGSHTIERVTGP